LNFYQESEKPESSQNEEDGKLVAVVDLVDQKDEQRVLKSLGVSTASKQHQVGFSNAFSDKVLYSRRLK
jgi:hypothetical protein